ncbi:hypothetical protein E2L06_01035 [Haloterrigena sp. H1]|uniref:hypothetical protein n=1 Tax=Haloterrigena sp. H1 TaxID=2552943 RepID=UPI00110DB6ED|nr:hypothetical protein [Haloterrigena sp. H1]TMT85261.1 hypothetical protein E2L06_01035 [Haloterrigena sp. H1]
MSRPPSRRTFLASVTAAVAVTTGGFERGSNATDTSLPESGTVSPDWYECNSVTRPEPTAPADDDALSPKPYPAQPPAFGPAVAHGRSNDSSLRDETVAYVTEFERVYRQNEFLARYGATARTVELRRTDYRTRTLESSSNPAIMAAIRYDLRLGTQQSATGPRDQWDVHTVYYVDEHIVLRARYHGVADELSFEPDPRTHGELVACFG